jgi:hypothetical protein
VSTSSLVMSAGHVTSGLRASKYFTLAHSNSPERRTPKLLYFPGSTWYNCQQLRWWHMACLGRVHITTGDVIMPHHFCSLASGLRASRLFTLAHSNSPERRTPEQVDLLTHVPFDGWSGSTPRLQTSGVFSLAYFVSPECRTPNTLICQHMPLFDERSGLTLDFRTSGFGVFTLAYFVSLEHRTPEYVDL